MGKNNLEKLNADLQKELNAENKKYYENLVIYVRCKTVIRDNHQSEELLVEILQDILEAQRNGTSAEEYFGTTPKQIADDVLQQLPVNLFDTIKLILFSLGSYLLFCFLPAMLSSEKSIDIGILLIGGLFATVWAIIILRLLGFSIYYYHSKFIKIVLIISVILGFIGEVLLFLFVSTPLTIMLSNSMAIILILLISCILLFLFYRQEDKSPWTPMIPILVFFAIFSIVIRLEKFSNILNTEKGQVIFTICLIVAVSVQFLFMFVVNKKTKK